METKTAKKAKKKFEKGRPCSAGAVPLTVQVLLALLMPPGADLSRIVFSLHKIKEWVAPSCTHHWKLVQKDDLYLLVPVDY